MESKIDFSDFDALLEFLIDSPVGHPHFAEVGIIRYLVIMKSVLMDPPQVFIEDGTLQVAENVVRNVGSIVSLFDLNKMNEFMTLELCLQLRDFYKLKDNRPDLKIYVERPKLSPYYPKTSAFIFIDHLLENLEELLKDTPSSIHPFNYFIMRVQSELQFWYSDLIEISSDPPSFLKEVIQTITELAYDTEYVIDSFLVGDVPSWLCVFWLGDILKEFEEIEQERMTEEDKEEDFKGKKTTLYDILIGTEEQLNIVTIVCPDLTNKGRNTFSDELYNSPFIIDHFDSRVRFSLYFDSDVNRICPVLDLLGRLIDLSDIIRSKNEDELTKLVYDYLEGKKFLVMISELWNIDDWFGIQKCFPDSQNGSRIVLTTSLKDMAFTTKYTNKVQPHQLRDKFQVSLFQEVSCCDKMFEVGMKIAKRCKPESMSWILHLLPTIRKTVNQWEEVANTLGSRVFGLAGSQEDRILDLTCIYLPDHLRSCFFYIKVFTFYIEVPILQMIQLWIAEGFVKHMASQSVENTAEGYATILMARNLLVKKKVLGDKERFWDPVDSVCTFLTRKVKEDNFVQFENSNNPNSSSSPTIYYQRRLVIESLLNEFKMLKPSGPFVHSLFCFNWSTNSIDISFVYNNFKFLRILNFKRLNIGESFIDVGALVLLRYLAVKSSLDFIPPSVANLQYLETFIFRQAESKVVKVPDFICDMTKLRHFDVIHSSSFVLDPHRLENSSSILDNLQTFSRPAFAYGDDMEKLLRKLLGLRELDCVFLDSWDDSTKCNRFPVLGYLNQLISLKVGYDGERKYPCKFNFPSNLKKLTLSNFQMPWNEISQLAMLNNLEILELVNEAFEGKRWEMEDQVVFPKLKFLGLGNMKFEYWSVTHDQFPHLQHLLVEKCYKLVEIPQNFANISTLLMIEVTWGITSVKNSAILIQEQHIKRWGHDELKISCSEILSESDDE